jgi:tetratricopeptide (TPR) repeat protein
MVHARLAALGLALITLLVYLPAGRHAFLLYDDPDYITQNTQVQAGPTLSATRWAFTTFHANNWHPLTWLSHMLDCELFGADAGAHHLMNVLLHSLNSVLLMLLLRRLTGALWPSVLVAALFAWHPLHVQSVAWASERKDVLSTLFFLLTLRAYVEYALSKGSGARPSAAGWRWYGAALGFFALGLLSKPMLVTLPFVLLLLDYWPLGRMCAGEVAATTTVRPASGKSESITSLVLEKVPFLLLSGGSCVVTFLAQRKEAVIGLEPLGMIARVENALAAYVGYLGKMIWPVDLAVIYPLKPVPVWFWGGALLMLLAIGWMVWRGRATRPHLLVGWLWYLGTLVPVIGLVQVGGQSMADRYTYIPLIGIFLALSFEAFRVVQKQNGQWRLAVLGASVLLLACVAMTVWQLSFWRDTETLFGRALEVTRNNAVAHMNLGAAWEEKGRMPEALGQYEIAVRINPSLAQAHNNLANALDATGRPQDALVHYREALRLKPGAFLAWLNYGGLLSRLGQHEAARTNLLEAARLAPWDPRPYYALGKGWLRQERPVDALREFEEALRRDPNHLPALMYAARTLAASSDPAARNGARAVQLALRASELVPEPSAPLLETLAMAWAETGQFVRAVEVQSRVLDALGSTAEAEPARARLALYRAGQPYRAKENAELAR